LNKKWKDIFFKRKNIPPISNDQLLKREDELKNGLSIYFFHNIFSAELQESKDFVVIPENLWKKLHEKFGGGF
jgi:hypothetical protein